VDATADLQRVVVLEVRVGNRAAVALYEAFGFAEISRRRGNFAAQRDAAVLWLGLPPD